MSLREAVRIALRGLRANRLRSVLTMLGIIIGVAAVILLVAIGNGVQTAVNEKVQPLANLITVVPSKGNVPGSVQPKDLIDGDVTALQRQVPEATAVVPAVTGDTLAETESTQVRARIVGSTERWFEVNNRDLLVGTFFDEAQVRSTARVAVLGPTVASTLFGDAQDTLSKTIRINRQNFRVIGVMPAVGEPYDRSVVLPLNTVRRYIFGGGDKINEITVQAPHVDAVNTVENGVI
jgi:putative ABC transport system permease protein